MGLKLYYMKMKLFIVIIITIRSIPLAKRKKLFFSENFDKGICTDGALIRLLRSHNEIEKAKEKLKYKENQTKRDFTVCFIKIAFVKEIRQREFMIRET